MFGYWLTAGRCGSNPIYQQNLETDAVRKTLIVLVALMVSCFAYNAVSSPQNQNSAIIVYYFHGTVRCPSCTLLEELIRETVEIGFSQELENGRITMQVINVDEQDHEHFVDDYSLSTQSIVLSQIENGKEMRWKNLDQIWTLLEDQGQLWEYLQNEITKFLKGAQK